MGKGSTAIRRSKHDRTKGKKARLARQATARGVARKAAPAS